VIKVNQAVMYRACDFIVLEIDKKKNTALLDRTNRALRGRPVVAELNKVYPAKSKPKKFKFVG